MQKQNKPLMLALLAGLALSGTAQATLIGRDLNGSLGSFEAYYDTDLNITWLADANYAKTSGYAADGAMDWYAANAWAASLSFTNGVNTYDNWRLPTTLQPDASCGSQSRGISYGYNCTGSEMGHLFYAELGGTANQSILTTADPDLDKFTNLQADYYWSATAELINNDYYAWFLKFNDGSQSAYVVNGRGRFYALAVSPGDVGAANNNTVPVPVPEPQTLALLGLGLLGLAAARRRGRLGLAPIRVHSGDTDITRKG